MVQGADAGTAGENEVSKKMEAVHISSEEHSMSTDSGRGKDSDEVSTGSHEGSEEDEGGDEDADGGGWITPSNIKQVKSDGWNGKPAADVKVGCVTTDFAMQVPF